jgi:nitrous oxidase accessory protein
VKWLFSIMLAQVVARAATIVATHSLQAAITAAESGDTILIHGPRVFSEQVVVDKSVRLLATNSPVLDGAGRGTPLLINAPKVEVSNLIVQNSGSDLSRYDSGIRIEADEAKITHCDIQNDGFGIYVRGANRCILRDNQIAGPRHIQAATRGNGIHLWKTNGNEIRRNSISGKRDGIYLSYADKNVIAENTVERSRFGIHYMYSHYNELMSNRLSANTVGATLMFARHCLVQGNYVSANSRHGILLKQLENSRVIGNRISGHNRGLFVQQAVQDRFEDNIISKNDMGLYLSGGSEENVFVRNSFIDNVDQVWQPPDEAERGRSSANAFFERGQGNFWSDYTGHDRNNDGFGDVPYHETDIYGYLLDRNPAARIFALSPAITLLRKGEELLPLMNIAGVTDLFPAVRPPEPSALTAGTIKK